MHSTFHWLVTHTFVLILFPSFPSTIVLAVCLAAIVRAVLKVSIANCKLRKPLLPLRNPLQTRLRDRLWDPLWNRLWHRYQPHRLLRPRLLGRHWQLFLESGMLWYSSFHLRSSATTNSTFTFNDVRKNFESYRGWETYVYTRYQDTIPKYTQLKHRQADNIAHLV